MIRDLILFNLLLKISNQPIKENIKQISIYKSVLIKLIRPNFIEVPLIKKIYKKMNKIHKI